MLILLTLNLSFINHAHSTNEQALETCPLPIEEKSWLYNFDSLGTGIELFNALAMLVIHNKFELTHDKFIGVRPYANVLMTSLTLGRLVSYFTGANEYYSYFCYASSALMIASITASIHSTWNSVMLRLPLPVWLLSAEQRALKFTELMGKVIKGRGTFMETTCTICTDDYVPGNAISHLDCGHDFHTDCLTHWIQTLPGDLCPLCRK